MKKETHPEMNHVIFVDSSNSSEYITMSTATSEETRDIDGVPHFIVRMEVTSSSHPFYTGEQRFVDSTGQVEKYQKKVELVEKVKAERGTATKKSKRKEKDTKKAARAALKDIFND